MRISFAVASRLRKRMLSRLHVRASVSGALFHVVSTPHVCSAISIRIEYGMKPSFDEPSKNHASAGQSNSAVIVPVPGLQSTLYHLLLPGSSSIPVTVSTRVVKPRSKAGERLDVERSKREYSGPRQHESLLHMNSHMLTHESGSSPGVWLWSFGLPGKGTKAIGRGGNDVGVKPGVGLPSLPASGCHVRPFSIDGITGFPQHMYSFGGSGPRKPKPPMWRPPTS